MQFVSTRGEAPVLGFSDAVLSGLAADGGLYVPQTWPQISHEEIAGFAGKWAGIRPRVGTIGSEADRVPPPTRTE